jgi:YidC/Oxa1 family membrane protein insertase
MQQPGAPGPAETRNLIIAIVLSAAILLGFEFFYNAPRARQAAQERAHAEEVLREQQPQTQAQTGDAPAPAATPAAREDLLSASASTRVSIDTAAVDGSITLEGARIDDLNLRHYRRTVDPQSPEVTLLAPIASSFGHDAYFGWEMQQGESAATLADAFSSWTAQSAARLTPDTPVTLTLAAGPGSPLSARSRSTPITCSRSPTSCATAATPRSRRARSAPCGGKACPRATSSCPSSIRA